MYATGSKKMLNMLILEILKEYSDKEHRLTQQEIIRLLKENYDMECDRRSVRNNIDSLIELGYDIPTDNGCYLAEREFEDAELRMLIDSVLFSRTISQAQAKRLIDKLIHQGSRYFLPKVAHVSNLPLMAYSENKQVMYTLDVLNDAIEEKKKVAFIYNTYGTDGKLHPRRAEEYIVNPYQMVANNGRYYLISNTDNHDNVAHYRIDRITDCRMLDEAAKPQKKVKGLENGLNLPKHMAEHIYLFCGESIPVVLEAEDGMTDDIIDWFGKDFRILSQKDGKIKLRVNCNENAMFYWALQYGAYVEVLEPKNLRDKVKNAVAEMNQKYT